MRRIREIFIPFRTKLLSLFFLFPAYLILYNIHISSARKDQIVLQKWARADFDLLSLNRALRILPLPVFESREAMTPAEVRLIQGWAIQGQVAMKDLEKVRTLFSHDQSDELDRLEGNFLLFERFLTMFTTPSLKSNGPGAGESTPSFDDIWSLERKLGLSTSVLSLSVRASRGHAEKNFAALDAAWERVYGGLLFVFLLVWLGIDARKLKKSQDVVFSKESQLQAVFNAIQDALVYADLDRRIILANPAVKEVFGYHPSDLVGRSVAVLYDRQEDFESQGLLRYRPDAAGDPGPYEMAYRRDDGSRFTGETRGSLVRDPEGRVQGFMVTVRDVTQRKEMMDRLFLEKEKWYVTLGSIGDAVIVADVHGQVEYINSIAEAMTGWSLADAKGQAVGEVFDIISEITRKPAENPVEQALRLGIIVGLANHTILRNRSGSEHAIEDSAAPIRNASGQVIGCVIVFRDVTQKRTLLNQVTHQANYDALTDLPNRYLFSDRMNQMLAQARRLDQAVALLYLDIDQFKKINDSFGHPSGDLILKEVGRRFREVVRESDTVARLGGDEFAIIACGQVETAEQTDRLARKILDVMARPFDLEGQELHLTASIGISLFPRDGNDATTLVMNADIAMYQAKEKGRNNFQFFSPIMNMSIQERTILENHLHAAFDHQEFQLYYQPIVDLERGTVVATEALIRWNHPQHGLICPARFIPMAEENGLIVPFGAWILETACRQAREWLDSGLPALRMAVNVSTRQLVQGDFLRVVEHCLASTGLPPDSLELELTESVLLQKTEKVMDVLTALHTMGVRLSIDDFGTGYSSLSYLTHFHAASLKIDGSFVQGLEDHPGNAAIITAILALGRAMALDVVAEGVETAAQMRFLKEHRCRLFQGYLLSRPVPAQKIPELLKEDFLENSGMLSEI